MITLPPSAASSMTAPDISTIFAEYGGYLHKHRLFKLSETKEKGRYSCAVLLGIVHWNWDLASVTKNAQNASDVDKQVGNVLAIRKGSSSSMNARISLPFIVKRSTSWKTSALHSMIVSNMTISQILTTSDQIRCTYINNLLPTTLLPGHCPWDMIRH